MSSVLLVLCETLGTEAGRTQWHAFDVFLAHSNCFSLVTFFFPMETTQFFFFVGFLEPILDCIVNKGKRYKKT